MAENTRDFKGVWIPKAVWLDERLTALDKIILTEIDSLDMGEDGCWASNKYIADFCQCTERKVSATVTKLIEYGYLTVKSFDGRQRILHSRVEKISMQNRKKCEADTKNLRQSNTYNKPNNKTSNKDIGDTRKRFVPPTLEEIRAYCLERKNNVDPQKFYDYFTASDWVDSQGKPVKNWKQKVITWESSNSSKTAPRREVPKKSSTDDFMDKLKAMYQANLEGDK